MRCCGEERSTRFCPECGSRLRQLGTLRDLLAHVSQRASHERAIQDNLERLLAEPNGQNDPEWLKKRVQQHLPHVLKWESWRNSLATLLDQGGTTERQDITHL